MPDVLFIVLAALNLTVLCCHGYCGCYCDRYWFIVVIIVIDVTRSLSTIGIANYFDRMVDLSFEDYNLFSLVSGAGFAR